MVARVFLVMATEAGEKTDCHRLRLVPLQVVVGVAARVLRLELNLQCQVMVEPQVVKTLVV